jgi:hypothetical protein
MGPSGPLVTDLPFGVDSVPEPQRAPSERPRRPARRGLPTLSDAALSWAIAAALAVLALALVAGGFAVRATIAW